MKKQKNRAQRELAKLLVSGIRPTTFEELDKVIPWVICGQYKKEAKALWENLHDKNIRSIVEVGRNRGGGLYLFTCMFPALKRVLSIDITFWPLTDDHFPTYFDLIGVEYDLVKCDSTKYIPEDRQWDFVYIDGGHTSEIVSKDISIWKDRAKYIGFHDFADRGNRNKHKRVYKDVVDVILDAEVRYGWKRFKNRGRSEVVFEVKDD